MKKYKKLTKQQYIQKLLENCELQETKITLANRKRNMILNVMLDIQYADYCLRVDQLAAKNGSKFKGVLGICPPKESSKQ